MTDVEEERMIRLIRGLREFLKAEQVTKEESLGLFAMKLV